MDERVCQYRKSAHPTELQIPGPEPLSQVGITVGGLEFFVHNPQALQYLFRQVVLEFRGQVPAIKYTAACRPR